MRTTIYVFRHAEAKGNLLKLLLGQKDTPENASLTPKGMQQAGIRSEEIKHLHFDSIYSSDLLRTQQTAEILRGHRDIAIQLDPLLRERTWGNFEGQDREQVQKQNKELFQKFDRMDFEGQWNFKFDGSVESYADLYTRFDQALQKILAQDSGKTIMVVSHSAMIRSLITEIDKKYFLKEVDYVAMVKIDLENGVYKIDRTKGIY